MRPVPVVSTVCSLFGGDQVLSAPIFTSPAGVQALCHEGGESATAQACGRFGTIFGLSQHSTQSIEHVSKLAPNTNKWYQCYILKDRQVTIQLIQRAIKSGYRGMEREKRILYAAKYKNHYKIKYRVFSLFMQEFS
jgi:isopentenyl diphosphate isomerase/L-lactate dehydrogenase-like FMN-dependent dehydrogenase